MNWRLVIAVVALLLGSALAAWFVLPADTVRPPVVSMDESAGPANQPVEPLKADPDAEPQPEGDAPPDRTLAGLPEGTQGTLADARPEPERRRFKAEDVDAKDEADEPNTDLAENPNEVPAGGRNSDAVGVGSAPITPGPAPAELTPALRWLEAGQHVLGYWGDGTFSAEGESSASTLVTALALLANIRAGHSHKQGPARAMVRAAILWARKVQDNNGNFASQESVDPLLHHAVATFAMAEAYGLTRDAVLKPIVDRAIEYCVSSRGDLGAWGMTARDTNPNVVVTGWVLLALKSASAAKLVVDKILFEDAANWAWSLRRGSYTAWSSASDAMPGNDGSLEDGTMADALLILALRWGAEGNDAHPDFVAALQRLKDHDPLWNAEGIDLMAWFFVAVALAPEHSGDWNAVALKNVNSAATTKQDENRAELRHWTSTDYWSERFGDVYTTALASILQSQCAPPKQD